MNHDVDVASCFTKFLPEPFEREAAASANCAKKKLPHLCKTAAAFLLLARLQGSCPSLWKSRAQNTMEWCLARWVSSNLNDPLLWPVSRDSAADIAKCAIHYISLVKLVLAQKIVKRRKAVQIIFKGVRFHFISGFYSLRINYSFLPKPALANVHRKIFLLFSFHVGVIFPLALVSIYFKKHCAVYVHLHS